ncbi:MAG TPA: rRNA maturation RNase YbeY [Longimicrobiales bacterium]|nr:rRNA maturation RNase YbeY [Longimicrobiales bacterium]
MPAAVRVQYGAALTARNPDYVDGAALRRLLRRAVRWALRHESVDAGEVSVTLLDNAEIADMNASFLQHEGPTDVISFALYEEEEDVVGDVYVGFDVARRQALAAGIPLEEELVRLTVHGTLHVLGYDHPEGEDRLDSEMWDVQEQVVARVLTV